MADNFERSNFSPSNLFNTAEDDTVKECDEPCCTEGAINQPTDLSLLRKSERVFGSGRNEQKRHFLPSWYKTFSWIHFCTTSLKVYCFYCKEMNKINVTVMSINAEPTFATTGFSNWKKATTPFKEHESSQAHRDAVFAHVSANSTSMNAMLQSQVNSVQATRRSSLMKQLTAL